MLLNRLIEVFSLVVIVETFENMTLLHNTVQNGEEGKRLSYHTVFAPSSSSCSELGGGECPPPSTFCK